jgi:hypothetical protein
MPARHVAEGRWLHCMYIWGFSALLPLLLCVVTPAGLATPQVLHTKCNLIVIGLELAPSITVCFGRGSWVSPAAVLH